MTDVRDAQGRLPIPCRCRMSDENRGRVGRMGRLSMLTTMSSIRTSRNCRKQSRIREEGEGAKEEEGQKRGMRGVYECGGGMFSFGVSANSEREERLLNCPGHTPVSHTQENVISASYRRAIPACTEGGWRESHALFSGLSDPAFCSGLP